jgi:hypothetical protein
MENALTEQQNSSMADCTSCSNNKNINLSDQKVNDGFTELKNLRSKYYKNILLGHLNINSLPSKFDYMHSLVSTYVDILVITETKTDPSYPSQQFFMQGFGKPFRADRNCFGGGIFIYVRENIPCRRLLNYSLPEDIEGIFVELNLRNKKWILCGTYKPPSQKKCYYLSSMQKAIDYYRSGCEKFVILGDLNMEMHESTMEEFCSSNEFYSLIDIPTCFKTETARCIDLILTNKALWQSIQACLTSTIW